MVLLAFLTFYSYLIGLSVQIWMKRCQVKNHDNKRIHSLTKNNSATRLLPSTGGRCPVIMVNQCWLISYRNKKF